MIVEDRLHATIDQTGIYIDDLTSSLSIDNMLFFAAKEGSSTATRDERIASICQQVNVIDCQHFVNQMYVAVRVHRKTCSLIE